MKIAAAKWISIATALAALFVFVAACSRTPFDNRQTTHANDGPLEIEIMADLTMEKPDMNNEYWTAFQQLTNTKLNVIWVPGREYGTKLDLVLASGDIPEVVFGRDHNRPTLLNAIRQDAFWDLTPFLGDFSQYPNLRDNMTPGAWNYVTVDGKIMGIPRSRSMIDSGLKMRKDWLEKLNLPVPTTLDEYEEALIKIVRSDPDGNGVNDTVGLAVGADPDASLQAAFGVYDPTYDDAGGLIYNSLTPQYTQLVEWLRKLYAEGVLPAEFAALSGNQLADLIQTGRAASHHYAIYRDYKWTEDIQKVQPEGELFTLPPLKGPNGNYSASLDVGTRDAFHISKAVPAEKVRKILKFFDLTASAEVTDFAYYGKEGVHYKVVDGEKVATELGKEQLSVNTLSPITPAYTRWGKVIDPSAPRAWNEAKKLEAEPYEKLGVIDPFRYLISDTWIEAWPKYQEEMKSMTVSAITGQTTMNDYKAFVEKVKADPQIKQAFREFAADLAKRKAAEKP